MSLFGSSNVHAVILAGGSGTRFWPASRRLRPKQLLRLGPSSSESLICGTVRRIEDLVPPERTWIATGAHLVESTRRELSWLPEESFLAEPRPRNTAPCIAWATAQIARQDPEALVMVLPSDQYAADAEGFRSVLRNALAAAADGPITTVGIVPTRPETGYGYIQVGTERGPGVHRVERFVEKPDLPTAREYLASDRYLWNSGMFFFRAKEMLRAVAEHLPRLAAGLERLGAAPPEQKNAATRAFFDDVESVSIDYGVMERESELSVVRGDFGWSDLGSWQSAWEVAEKDDAGNAAPEAAVLVGARNNLVTDLSSAGAASGKKIIALVGVEDLCVVETDDALLVIHRERSQDVREVVAELERRQLPGST
jgi:mannose-1-phosphate guanylyltransferase